MHKLHRASSGRYCGDVFAKPIRFVEQVAGLCLLTLILVDIFVTVLYARAGSGLIAPHVERAFWRVIRRISTVSIRKREHILAFGGPLLVVTVVAMWFVGLSFGAALVIHPALGSGVRASNGETPSSFIAALFAGGSSGSIVGSGALEPNTETFRLFYFFTAHAGTAVTSLVLTYLMQVYTALLRRNTVALDIDTWSGQTGDAVELLTRLFPEGQTSAGYNVMVQWASAMTSVSCGADSDRARCASVRVGTSFRCARAAGRIGANAARHAGPRKRGANGQQRRERGIGAMPPPVHLRCGALAARRPGSDG